MEALVALALGGLMFAMALPAVLTARSVGAAAAHRAGLLDAGRLISHRLRDDLWRAGFGLGGMMPAVTLGQSPPVLRLHFLEGGFEGGRPLAAAVSAGERHISLMHLAGLKVGDTVMLQDRWRRGEAGQVVSIDQGARTISLAGGLALGFSPEQGAAVWRVVRRRWHVEAGLLRRDGQPALDAVSGFFMQGHEPARAMAGLPAVLAGEPMAYASQGTTLVATGLFLQGGAYRTGDGNLSVPGEVVTLLGRLPNQRWPEGASPMP